jgi:predicted O-linked N-acetylglucosamine transferase (SPINDLY family)
LLKAAGLPQLITESPQAFRQLAIDLGNNPTAIAALRAQLETSRTTCALFDTPRFVRNLESLLYSVRP